MIGIEKMSMYILRISIFASCGVALLHCKQIVLVCVLYNRVDLMRVFSTLELGLAFELCGIRD